METIEKLTDKERAYIQGFRVPEATKALRIIDQLTAALDEAKKPATSELGEAIVAAVYATSEPASLLSRVYKAITDTLEREPSGFPVARSRAEALQARVAELEDENSQMYSAGLNQGERLDAAESELATAKARVAELEERTQEAERSERERFKLWLAADAELADLRGRVGDARRKLTCPNRSDVTRIKDALEALRGR